MEKFYTTTNSLPLELQDEQEILLPDTLILNNPDSLPLHPADDDIDY